MSKEIFVKCRGIIVDDGRLFVVRHTEDNEYVALPGGHLEWGEDPATAVKREILEELGVAPEVGDLLYVNTFSCEDGRHYIEFFFEIKNSKDYLSIDHLAPSHAFELCELLWLDPEKNLPQLRPTKIHDDFKEGKLLNHLTLFIS
ncbi:MAG: NUDIX domain-containing protein [bacterium]|nr:NUDIX domain-containing protein [bacterium]